MEEPLNIERDVVKNGVRLDCVFEGYEYRPEREEVRSQRLAGFECVEIAENTGLSLDKVVDVIRYFAASTKITSLYKVKLMKLMWYADALSYKKRGFAITGLVYQALPMGAVPVGHN